ncbi:hypothetical protein [Terracidiphilus gabretensis]|jgi:hypothetical protein|uniref:hypothetical protein n=1 Tax=Terracidiphilus gabretensis TaxID=1577687 RepID=UPI00071BFC49|nr:hypothetical protein [Terracidiphilus gabretensis]
MRITLRSLVLTLAVLAPVAFTAQTASAAANVRVPFTFNVDGKTLPAGTYSVVRDLNGSFVKLISSDSKFVGQWLLQSGDAKPTDTAITLRFDEGDGAYALRSIQYNATITKRLDKNVSEVRAIHIVHGR